MKISYESQQELFTIHETRVIPDGHFLNFADFDPLIFGADGPQREYLDCLLQWLHGPTERDVARFHKEDYTSVSNFFIDWSKRGGVDKQGLYRWDDASHYCDEQEQARRDFVQRFNASRLRLGDISADTLERDPQRANKLIRGVLKDNLQHRPTWDNLTSKEVRSAVRQFAVRRACKFLIHDAIRQWRPIAYVLDDLDLDAVVSKTTFELETKPGSAKLPVCTSELREVFRRWDVCGAMVQFFKDLHRVPPPWDSYWGQPTLEKWSAYAAARAKKLADRIGPKHPQFDALCHVLTMREVHKDHAVAIMAYHAARPSSLSPLPNAVWEH